MKKKKSVATPCRTTVKLPNSLPFFVSLGKKKILMTNSLDITGLHVFFQGS